MFAKFKNDPLYQDLNWRLVLIGCVANLGAMGFGFDNGFVDTNTNTNTNAGRF